MSYTQKLIERVIAYFLPYSRQQDTMLDLQKMAADPTQWRFAHELFGRIRRKTINADKTGNELLQHQFSFEEICAKTMFNLSDHCDPQCKEFPARFDEDSCFYFFPIAIAYANRLGRNDFVTTIFPAKHDS